MMMVKFSLDLAYLAQSFHSWRRNSRINRGSILSSDERRSFLHFSRWREREREREKKKKQRKDRGGEEYDTWNESSGTILLIQRPRSALYIGGKGRSHTTEHNWFHSVNLLEQRKYRAWFFSFRTRDRGSLDTPDALEQANFESSRSEKSELDCQNCPFTRNECDFGRKGGGGGRKRNYRIFEMFKYRF